MASLPEPVASLRLPVYLLTAGAMLSADAAVFVPSSHASAVRGRAGRRGRLSRGRCSSRRLGAISDSQQVAGDLTLTRGTEEGLEETLRACRAPYLQALLRAEGGTTTGSSSSKESSSPHSDSSNDDDAAAGVPLTTPPPQQSLAAGGGDRAFVTRPTAGACMRLNEKWISMARGAADKQRTKQQQQQRAHEASAQRSAVGWHEVLCGTASLLPSNDIIAKSFRTATAPAAATAAAKTRSQDGAGAAMAGGSDGGSSDVEGLLLESLVNGSLQDLERHLGALTKSSSSIRFVCSDASSAFHGLDLLSIAAASNNLGAARLLLDRCSAGASGSGTLKVNLRDRQQRRTPLHQACMRGNVDMAKLLLAEGADARVTDRHGYSCLHLAVMARSLGLVSYIVGGARSLRVNVNLRSREGLTPLMLCRDRDIAICLLGAAANPYVQSAEGLDYYCILVRSRAARLLETVLNCNVNRSRPTTTCADSADGRAQSTSALVLACKLDFEDCAAALMDSYSMSASLSRYASECDERGMTALHYICTNGNLSLLRRALAQEHGRGLLCENSDGATPLALALLSGHEAVVRELADHEGSVCLHRENSAGYTCAELLLLTTSSSSSGSNRGGEGTMQRAADMTRVLVSCGLVLRNKTIVLMCRLSRAESSGASSNKVKVLCAHGLVQGESQGSGCSTSYSSERCSSSSGSSVKVPLELTASPLDFDLVLLSRDGRRLHCHSNVLIDASQKMRAYLDFNRSSRSADASEGVFLDVPYDLLLLLVRFAYSGAESLSPIFLQFATCTAAAAASEDLLLELLWLADEFIMPQLVLELERGLCRRLASMLRLSRTGQGGAAATTAAHRRSDVLLKIARILGLGELLLVAAFVCLSSAHAGSSDGGTLADAVDALMR